MQQIILIFHVLVSISLIALVLIQHGKGADVGAAFGSGASNTMFGSAGSTPFLVKVTGLLAAIFFITSLGLTYLVSSHVKSTLMVTPVPITAPSVPPVDIPANQSTLPANAPPAESVPVTPN